jgi:hypothetical protein
VLNELTFSVCKKRTGVLIVRGPGEYILPDCMPIELAVIDEVNRAPVYRVPSELSMVAVRIFIELRPGPPTKFLETKSELTSTEGV